MRGAGGHVTERLAADGMRRHLVTVELDRNPATGESAHKTRSPVCGRITSGCSRVTSVRSVPETAVDMGLSVERVRQLIAAGKVSAVRLGGRWVVDDAPLRPTARVAGRPWSAGAAWGLVWLGLDRPAPWLSAKQRQRARHRWEEGLNAHLDRLASRSEARFFRSHPAALRRLASDRRVVLSGVSAADAVDADLVASEELEVYVRAADLGGLVTSFGLEQTSEGTRNVVARVVAGEWPFVEDEHVAPALVVAIDLMESTDQRTERAGRALLARELKRLRN